MQAWLQTQRLELRRQNSVTDVDAAIAPPPFPEYADRPLDFFREILGLEPWAAPLGRTGQIDVVRTLGRHKSMAIRAGHKVSKSNTAAGAGIWWYCTRPLARVVLTAPTTRQVERVLWRETTALFRRAMRRAAVKGRLLGGELTKKPSTGIQSEDGREIFGFSTDDPDHFSGISGPNILYIVDEAPGVAEEIFEAIEGNRAGGAHLFMAGNPTQTSGKFYDAFHTERDAFLLHHLSSESTPKGEQAIPGLASEDWIEERRTIWGVDSQAYQVRVLGNFPTHASDTVIGLGLLDESQARYDETEFDGPLQIGVDPARFGDDDTVIQPRRGNKTYELHELNGPITGGLVLRSMDTIDIAGHVLQVVRALRQPDEDPPVVCIDTIGIGAGVFDQLLRSDEVVPVSVDSSRQAPAVDDYHNTRAQLHFCLRDWMRDGGAVHHDPVLEGEIVAPRYKYDARNRYVIESKDEIKKRIRRSPNRMDALQLAVWRPPVSQGDLDIPDVPGSRWDSFSSQRGFG